MPIVAPVACAVDKFLRSGAQGRLERDRGGDGIAGSALVPERANDLGAGAGLDVHHCHPDA